MNREYKHIPVMLDEVLENLDIKEDGIYVDCTMGGAGHASEILKRIIITFFFLMTPSIK